MAMHASYEMKKHGLNAFPMEYYHVDRLHPRYEMPFHWHMECELISVVQGSFHISLNGNFFLLTPGTFAFIPGGTIHGGFPSGQDTIYECIVFDLDFFCQSIGIEQGIYAVSLNYGANISNLFSLEDSTGRILQSLFQEGASSGPGHKFFVAGLIFSFIGSVIQNRFYNTLTEGTSHNSTQVQQIKNVLTRIRQDFHLPLSLEELSAEAALAPNYLCRLFHSVTGRPPIDYLNYYRVERATELILTTNKNMTDIALQCGFNDPCYFSRCFRKYKGLSPREYRKQAQKVAKTG